MLIACCVILAQRGLALGPARAAQQYVHERWGAAQGLPAGRIYAISQTKDGYLWVASEAGLYRFNGVNFTAQADNSSTALPLHDVLGLQSGPDGSLWIRLSDPTLVRYHDGVFTPVTDITKQEDPRITAIGPGARGQLVFASRRGGAAAWTGSGFASIAAASMLPQSPATAITQTPDGTTWLGTREAGLARVSGNTVTTLSDGLRGLQVNCLLPLKDSTLLVGTNKGLLRCAAPHWSAVTDAGLLQHVPVLAMLQDHDGGAWVGTGSSGLFRLSTSGVPVHDSMSAGRSVTALFEDREGDIWVGDDAGLERIRGSIFSNQFSQDESNVNAGGPLYADSRARIWFAPASGGLKWHDAAGLHSLSIPELNGDVVYSIAGHGDDLWLGRQHGGLTHVHLSGRSMETNSITQKNGLPQNTIYTVQVSPDGSVWAGTLNSGACRLRGSEVECYTRNDGLAADTVSAIAVSRDGTVWLGTPDGLSEYRNGKWKTYRASDGLLSSNVYSLLADSHGSLWAGTLNGLSVIRSGSVKAVASAPAREPIYGIAEDRAGRIWIVTPKRLFSFAENEPASAIAPAEDVREYTAADGLADMQGVKRSGSIVTDAAGSIVVSRSFGFSIADPARILAESVPTIVHVVNVDSDGSALDLRHRAEIRPNPNRVAIEYEGLNLNCPGRIRYRYKLDGYDVSWSPPLSTKEAVYTRLPPGEYRFNVMASDGEGKWNGSEASIALKVHPSLWQTTWFRASLAFLIALGCVLAYRMRIRHMTEQVSLRFDERLAERTRLARELHDTLLQTIQGSKMVADDALDDVSGAPDAVRMRAALERVTVWLEDAIQEGRRALSLLRGPNSADNDLATALRRVAEECSTSGGLEVNFALEGSVVEMHPVIRDEVYRIGYEAIRNACRHSEGKLIEIELSYARNFVLRVRDDGCGISAEIAANGKDGHFGLIGMHERAERVGGRLNLFSSARSGTEVELIVPGSLAFYGKRKSRMALPRRYL